MTLQDLTNNRDRIIRKIQSQMSGDANAKKMMVKPVMTKMVAIMSGDSKYAHMKPTMGNIDKLTSTATLMWIKYDYKPTMTVSEKNAFDKKREAAKYNSISW